MKYEFLKLFSNKKIIILFIVCFVINIFLAMQNRTIMYEGFNAQVYKYYMEELQGDYNNEKYAYVMNEYANMQLLLENEDLYEKQYMDKSISAEEYKEISSKVSMAKSRIKTFEYIVEKTEYFSQCKNSPSYFYDLKISDYITNMNVNIPLLIVLFLSISTIFNEDYYSNTIRMIHSSQNGKERLFHKRIVFVILITFAMSILFYLSEFAVKYLYMDLGDLNANISSLLSMKETNINITIGGYLLIAACIRIFYTVIVSMCISCVAVYTHKYIVTFAISLGVIILPALLSDSLLLMSRGMEVYPLLNTTERVMSIPVSCVSVVLYGIVGVLVIVAGRWKFARE